MRSTEKKITIFFIVGILEHSPLQYGNMVKLLLTLIGNILQLNDALPIYLSVLIDKLLLNLCIEHQYVLMSHSTEKKITIFLSVGILEHSPLIKMNYLPDKETTFKKKVQILPQRIYSRR